MVIKIIIIIAIAIKVIMILTITTTTTVTKTTIIIIIIIIIIISFSDLALLMCCGTLQKEGAVMLHISLCLIEGNPTLDKIAMISCKELAIITNS